MRLSTVENFRYGLQVGVKSELSSFRHSIPMESMLGKCDDTSDRVRLRTREDRAANTGKQCAPHMSHSVLRRRLVAMLCLEI